MDKKSQVQIAYSKLTNKAQNNFTCFVKISFLIFFFLFFLFIGYFFFLIENLNVQKAKSLLLFFLYFFFTYLSNSELYHSTSKPIGDEGDIYPNLLLHSISRNADLFLEWLYGVKFWSPNIIFVLLVLANRSMK